MNVGDIISRVRNIAGDTNVLQFEDSHIIDWINDGVKECAINNNLLQKRAVTIVTDGATEYDIPSDILKLHTVRYDDRKIPVYTLDQFDSLDVQVDHEGTPQLCYIWASKINLWPAPNNSESVLTVDYTYEPSAIPKTDYSSLVPNLPPSYHARLVDYCLAQVAQQDGDTALYTLKMQEFATGVQSLKDQSEWEYDQYPMITTSPRDWGDGYYG